jgi:ketosteroid isomerase-like protein
MTDDDLAYRVRRLEHIELAKAATVEYGRACDRKDVAALRTDVFTDDIVLHLPGRDVHGRDDVAAFYTGAFGAEPGTRRHFVTNQLASVDDAGRVVVESYFLFLSADATSVIGWGAYRDVVVVADDGAARIADKTIVLDVHTDVTKGWAMEPAR